MNYTNPKLELVIAYVNVLADCDSWENKYLTAQNNLSSANASYKRLSDVLDKMMLKTPILATNIEVRDYNGSYGSTINHATTTYMTPKATFISNSDISNKTIYVKMYSNGTLRTGDTSPKGYSYSDNISLTKYQPEEIEFTGWGNDIKGNWPAGTHRVEFWADGECIGSKTFTIK